MNKPRMSEEDAFSLPDYDDTEMAGIAAIATIGSIVAMVVFLPLGLIVAAILLVPVRVMYAAAKARAYYRELDRRSNDEGPSEGF